MEFGIIGIDCAAPDNYAKNQLPLVHCPSKSCVRGDPKPKPMAAPIATPSVDVMEYPNSYVFAVDVPGLKPSDVKVEVEVEDANILKIAGEGKRDEEDINNEVSPKYLKLERKSGTFTRKFVLPENANTDSISATCRNGLLMVTVGKLPPAEPKTVQVQVA
ncbi:17.3 kDa class II heat shock protein-like [Diospyros lotus]|uniref:17.3 kDa class II heat shock protein-like n=1 Tax=Diospyros lotus TaxID=55363 RepID=UPI0022516E16|nr:17.3 kDa class II heat shock protein-like [Diospyros lotus]